MNPGPPPCKGGVLTRLDDGPEARWASLGSPFITSTPFRRAASARSSSAEIPRLEAASGTGGT